MGDIRMKTNSKCLSLILSLCLFIVLTGCGNGVEAPDQPPKLPDDSDSLVKLAKFDLNLRFGFDIEEIETKSVEETLFDDASLGVPQPGATYEPEITPGYIITLEADGENYTYHASAKIVVFVPEPE
jgi:hypothetical protein